MITVLLSGGIDSWACLNWAAAHYGLDYVQPIYVVLGQHYAEAEILCATAQLEHLSGALPLRVIDLASLLPEAAQDGHMPLRNIFLLLIAAVDESSEGVVFGMLRGESSEDKNNYFLDLMTLLLDSQFRRSIYRAIPRDFAIHTPFAKMTKREMMAWSKAHTDIEYALRYSVGCINKEQPCGGCISCFNRWVALYLNDLPEDAYVGIHPFYWMLGEILRHWYDPALPPRSSLLSLKQIWLKRHWLWDSFTAMHRYARLTANKELLTWIRSQYV